ncbi:hypothetical protein [Synechococcus elongatus]|uniref:Uncharacterized protein n=1 Tax=Synechococcus elongatus PCC 11801 TaxID=2219813 RepID=A0AAQ3R8P8_SYNEL
MQATAGAIAAPYSTVRDRTWHMVDLFLQRLLAVTLLLGGVPSMVLGIGLASTNPTAWGYSREQQEASIILFGGGGLVATAAGSLLELNFRQQRRQRQKQRLQRFLHGLIRESQGSLGMIEWVTRASDRVPWPTEELKSFLKTEALLLNAEVSSDELGNIRYRFPFDPQRQDQQQQLRRLLHDLIQQQQGRVSLVDWVTQASTLVPWPTADLRAFLEAEASLLEANPEVVDNNTLYYCFATPALPTAAPPSA